MDILSYIQIVQ